MEKEPIKINVQLTEKDLEDFFSHLSKRSIVMKMLIVLALIVFGAQLTRVIINPNLLEEAIGWIVFVLFLFGMMIYSNKYNARKVAKINKRLFEQHTYLIEDEYIKIEGGPFNGKIKWTDVYRLTESKNSLFVWLDKKRAQIIPKRYISEDEIKAMHILYKLSHK